MELVVSPPIHPPEATSQQTYVEDANRQIVKARESGGYTAVLKLATDRQLQLQRELAALTAGHELRRMTNVERDELRRQWSPEKVRLDEQITELQWWIGEWSHVERQALEPAANEKHGWTLQEDGSYAKPSPNGKTISAYGGVRYEEDGEIVDTSTRSDQWHRRHRAVTRDFGTRVRAERLAKARSRTRAAVGQRRAREHRPRVARRTSSSSSSSDPPDSEPPRRRGYLRHISAVLTDAAWIPCPFCEQPLHERDGAHCGGCRITWWEGVR
jgi:hypothetical protein